MHHDALVDRLEHACGPGTPPEVLQEAVELVDGLLLEHQDRVYGVCRRFVGDRDQALALAQVTLAAAVHRLGEWRGSVALWPWLYELTRTVCLGALAHRRDLLTVDGVLIPGSARSVALARLRRETFEELLRQVTADVLLTDEQDAVYLRYAEGLDPAQINEVMHLEGTGARGLLQRCRHKLGRLLRAQGPDIDDHSVILEQIPHPPLEQLTADVPKRDVAEHLTRCSRCRVDRRRVRDPHRCRARELESIRGSLAEARARALARLPSSWRTTSRIGGGRDDADQMALLPHGTRIGGYRVDGLVHRTGLTHTYRAIHGEVGSRHLVKILAVRHPKLLKRLAREGRHLSQFRHPNVTSVVGHLDIDGLSCVVLEHVDGPVLDDLLALGAPWADRDPSLGITLPLDLVDALAIDILSGVAAGHASGLVHRDLRPANVLLDPTEGRLVARVNGHGLASVLAAVEPTSAYGTAPYLAPEQLSDASRGDARSDVFALGTLLYELCTSQVCFAGLDHVDTVRRVHALEHVPCRTLRPDLPERMVLAIEACLRIDPDARPKSAAALLDLWTRGAGDAARPAIELDAGAVAAVRDLRRIEALPSDPEATEHETPATLIGGTPAPLTASSALEPRGGAMAAFFGVVLILGGTAAAAMWAMGAPSGPATFWQLAPQFESGVDPVLSPDGRLASFSDQQDLHLLRIEGGDLQNLTEGLEPAASAPAFSPNGEHLVFCADGGLWWRPVAEGSPSRIVAEGHHPAWFPDGWTLAYGSGQTLFRVDIRTGEPVAVIDATSVAGVAVSPHGDRIVWVDEGGQMWIVPAEGGHPSWIADGVRSPRWIDADTLGAVCSDGVEVCAWADEGPAGFADPVPWLALPNRAAGFDVAAGRVVVGLDLPVRGVLWVADRHAPSEWTVDRIEAQGAMGVPDLDGRHEAILTDPQTLAVRRGDGPWRPIVRGRDLGPPAWRPRTSRITFSGQIDGVGGIYEVSVDGTGLQRIGTEPATGGVWWSPTGSHLGFTPAGGGAAVVVEPDLPWGPQLELARLAPLPGIGAGPFSPDGDRMVVSLVAGFGVVELATGRSVVDLPDAAAVAWSNDRELIVIRGPRIERYDLATATYSPVLELSPWKLTRPAAMILHPDGGLRVSVERQAGGMRRVDLPTDPRARR